MNQWETALRFALLRVQTRILVPGLAIDPTGARRRSGRDQVRPS